MKHKLTTRPWKIAGLTILFSAPFALGIYLTLRDSIPLLYGK